MIDEYRISIIIPVYHVEEYILQCLQSVAAQTMTEGVECILVDDCGGDKSIDIAKRFIEEYHGAIDFKIVYRENNGGLSAARNSGIDVASGEYIYFLDSDDEIMLNTLEGMWQLIEKYGKVDSVHGCAAEKIDDLGKHKKYNILEYNENQKNIKTFLLSYDGDIIGAQGRLIRRSFLLEHNLFFKSGIIHEDNYWSFFVAKYIKTLAFDSRMTYYHRYNPASITNKVNVVKESTSYKQIIEAFSLNIDDFVPGRQKEFLLCNLLTVLSNKYYDNEATKNGLINDVKKTNSYIEAFVLNIIARIQDSWFRSKLIHFLIRLYKLHD